ncbi:TIGR01244 family phosphatase [Proteobacteria bacterium 005FR1]|nr:TIGR01244 family phosphatase [Proteobacteria bacterium 005FR1]
MIDVKPIVPGKLAVAPQPRPEHLPILADQGYKTLISNRPDREAPDQPHSSEMESAAERQGMKYVYIPVDVDSITRKDVEAFRQCLDSSPAPALAHCGSGKRSFLLWAAGQVLYEGKSVDEMQELARDRGVDAGPLKGLVERLK